MTPKSQEETIPVRGTLDWRTLIAERDAAREEVKRCHAEKAAIGGSPCICAFCQPPDGTEEGESRWNTRRGQTFPAEEENDA